MVIKRAGAGVVVAAGAVALTAAMLSSLPTATEPTLPPNALTAIAHPVDTGPRLTTPQPTTAFEASDDLSSSNGANIVIDGGVSAMGG